MNNILDNQVLEMNNLLSFRGILTNQEIELVGRDMDSYINSFGARRIGYPITATYSTNVENGISKMDIELLLQTDKKIQENDKYVFKNKFKLVYALVQRSLINW